MGATGGLSARALGRPKHGRTSRPWHPGIPEVNEQDLRASARMTEANLSTAEREATADVSAQRVARVYAEALLNAAQAQNQAEEVLGEMESLVGDVFRADAAFEGFLTQSAAGRERKAALIRKVFADRASSVGVNFLLVLNAHDRLDLLRAIVAEARELLNRRTNHVR